MEIFKDLVICLGPVHWTCVLLRCQGKLLRGSGPDDAVVECGVFGPGVVESVLNGSHSVRAHWYVNCGGSYSITPVEDVLASETKQIILCCSK